MEDNVERIKGFTFAPFAGAGDFDAAEAWESLYQFL